MLFVTIVLFSQEVYLIIEEMLCNAIPFPMAQGSCKEGNLLTF